MDAGYGVKTPKQGPKWEKYLIYQGQVRLQQYKGSNCTPGTNTRHLIRRLGTWSRGRKSRKADATEERAWQMRGICEQFTYLFELIIFNYFHPLFDECTQIISEITQFNILFEVVTDW